MVRVLLTLPNGVLSLPSHRLLGLVRTALPAQWQRDYQPRVQPGQRPYYYQMVPGPHTDACDYLVPNASPASELVPEVPHQDIGGLATTQAYFLEETDYIVQGFRIGTTYHTTHKPFCVAG